MEVWKRLLGCFGESLIRKFGDEPPQEWIAGIASLDEIKLARGMRRLVFSGKPHPPSLPEFLRLCRMVQDDEQGESPSQYALPNPAGNFDMWDLAANNHLLGYITRRLSKEPRAWGAPNSGEQAAATKLIVRYKHAWAADMREGRGVNTETGEVIPYSTEEQKSSWDDLMRQGEDAIALLLGKAAA